MRQNLAPGICLQIIALALALLYGYAAPLRLWFDAIGSVKLRYGYLFSAASTAFFGGALPFLILVLSGRLERRRRLAVLAFYVGFWIWKGVEVDAFYRLQAWLFGNQASVAVILKKLSVDQFIYNPLWAGPTQVGFFLWKDCDFSLARMRLELGRESFGRRVLVLLVSSWIVWIPTVAIVYALPAALQIPLFNLALCFWCILMSSISQDETRPSART